MDGSNTIPPRTPPTLNGTFHIVPIADNGDGVRRGKGMLYEVISTFADPLGKEELQKEDPTVSGGRVPRTSRMRPEP